ncbi:MAG: DUF4190 domain-containing protein [Candidatus Lokiarchaeota archaeon]|nr:DUF4190 domain-containing protein [Candidatus Lokiarchaeota archaeon]
MGKVFGILALLCGILGFVGWLLFGLIPFDLPYSAFYLPGAAILLGIIGLIVDDPKGMAIAGLILGIIGIVFIIFILPMLIVFLVLAGLGVLLGL